MTPLPLVGQRAALRPQRRKFARGVEFLDRGPFGLAVEIAQRFRAQHVAQFVGDRLIGRRDVAGGLDRFLGGLGGRRCGGRSRRSCAGVAVAVSFLAVSLLLVSALAGVGLGSAVDSGRHRSCRRSAAGAVTTSDGLVSAAFSRHLRARRAPARCVSGLKSLTVGGGTLAGSGRGIAASIASSAALLRAGSVCASAEVADTVRKVAATAISTRSNPARFFEQSRIVTPLGRNCSGMEQLLVSSVTAFAKAPASIGSEAHSVQRHLVRV